MNNLKSYRLVILFLLLLNITLVGFFFLTMPRKGHMNKNRISHASKILNLNTDQQRSFSDLFITHRKVIDSINTKQRELLVPYFNTVFEANKHSATAKNIERIQEHEKEKIQSTYDHLQDVKSILNQEQLKTYKTFVKSMFDRKQKKEH